ncbi:DMT family transporter [Roseicyclus mahoneyensis]|uniref:Drug/metabolite transporter (DMT)-like permease n=1 Tax=Roseicyclus mahoneyensis TaxID=164332 RepID=A0A316GPL3_9RHOB|nr:DMT family transporter [Roseicyclus mahoneyensis]PWK62824.1 drug/metabolite transporter (DMT)-like permease [Roseicyclus mahoneyensis]
MAQKDRIDAFGATALTGFAALLAFNQVVIAVVNDGLQPVFFAALRSMGGALCIWLWMIARGLPVRVAPGTLPAGLLIGTLFAVEFICLFVALDLTTVTRTSVIFYTMPVWLALMAHVSIPGEGITGRKGAGLALAFAGVVVAITLRGGEAGRASLLGDLCALGAALAWAGIALVAKASPLRTVRPETQLLWQLAISAPILMLAAIAFGPFLRDPDWVHWAGLGFQIVVIVSAGFLGWLWLLSIYPASSVAAFSFLSPVFGVGLGWLLLDERVGWDVALALALVVTGLILVNRPERA